MNDSARPASTNDWPPEFWQVAHDNPEWFLSCVATALCGVLSAISDGLYDPAKTARETIDECHAAWTKKAADDGQ